MKTTESATGIRSLIDGIKAQLAAVEAELVPHEAAVADLTAKKGRLERALSALDEPQAAERNASPPAPVDIPAAIVKAAIDIFAHAPFRYRITEIGRKVRSYGVEAGDDAIVSALLASGEFVRGGRGWWTRSKSNTFN
jgi:hypothetical protein